MGQLEIDSLVKRFRGDEEEILAVDSLDLSIEDGEFLVLVGPSGCGKSTTLRCIAGLETPTEGEIRLDGTDVSEEKPKDRDMAMVFQNYALYPHMTARENMSFGLKMSTDMSDGEIAERVEETAAMMGIDDLLEDKPSELSGGQQQRVALGRAIVRDPEVFLMDEPLSNLDAKLRTQMRTELQNLQGDLGVTTIYVTHDQTEAMTMGDRIAILDDGRLQQVGTPLECYYRPANRFVAGFVGSPSMNFLDVEYRDGELRHDSFGMSLSRTTAERLDAADSDLVLGIRPEDAAVTDDAAGAVITEPATVVEPMGDLTHVYLEIGGKTFIATVSGDSIVRAGQEISLTFPEDRIHLFDRETGAAIKNSAVLAEHDESSLEPTRSDEGTV